MLTTRAHMVSPTVRIPPVDKDTRIGNVFNDIFNIIYQTEQTELGPGDIICWDFSACSFLHPFYVGAIAVLKRQYGDSVRLVGLSAEMARYFSAVLLDDPLEIHREDNDGAVWRRYKGKTYLPVCVFNPFDASSDKAQELVEKAIYEQLGLESALKHVVSLLLGELIDNITEHSMSKEGFLFCQRIPKHGVLYIMICDTGRSIYSSYAADERYCGQLSQLESSGLLLALSGKSTKDLPDDRGYGISKSRKLVVEGLGGEFFILSGGSFARHDASGEAVFDLPQDLRWNGTAVLLKIPVVVPKALNIYDYIS